jgi:hypothetical protein
MTAKWGLERMWTCKLQGWRHGEGQLGRERECLLPTVVLACDCVDYGFAVSRIDTSVRFDFTARTNCTLSYACRVSERYWTGEAAQRLLMMLCIRDQHTLVVPSPTNTATG